MKKLIISLLLAVAVIGSGCLTKASNELVPKTGFEINDGNGKKLTGEFPKDMNVGFAEYRRSTNGTVSLTLSNITSKMNAEVITESGKAQSDQIRAMTELYKANMDMMKDLTLELMKRSAPIPVK
jgi:hypothetical protein